MKDENGVELESADNAAEDELAMSDVPEDTEKATLDVGADAATESEAVGQEVAERSLAELSQAIEAILMVSPDPVPDSVMGTVLGVDETVIRHVCLGLADSYASDERGFELINVAGGWRYQSHPDQSEVIEQMVIQAQTTRLSGAALETLSIIAYKQPISRAQISAIRGVNVDGVLKTLSQRGYVIEQGRDDGPGQAMLFGTTDLFLEKVGLSAASDLPPLGDFVPPAHVLEALEQTLRAEPDVDPDLDLTAEDETPANLTTQDLATEGLAATASAESNTVEPNAVDLTSTDGPADVEVSHRG